MSGEPPRTRYCSRCLTTFQNDPERCPNLGCRGSRPVAGWGELLEVGDLIDRTYRIHQRLAIGGAGATYLARETDAAGVEVGPALAVKVLYAQRDQGPYLRRLATEAQILQGLNHPQIVECRGFVHRTGHSPYLVTRFEEGGSLLDHLREHGPLPVAVAANVGRQICWALEVAHRQGVVHRDLKPENVLLVRRTAKGDVPDVRVADFGIAKVYGGFGDRLTRVGAFVGTPQYAAPEQFDGLTPEPAADVYAVGALLVMCMTLRPVLDVSDTADPEVLRDRLLASLPPQLDLPGEAAETVRHVEETLAWAMAVEPQDRCDVAVLDERLAAIAGGRDPGPVRRSVATPSGMPLRPASTRADDVAVTSPGVPPPALTGPRAMPPPPRSAGGLGVVTSDEPRKAASRDEPPRVVTATHSAPRMQPPPLRTLTLDTIPAPARRTMGCGLLGLVGLGAALVIGVAGYFVAVPRTQAVPLTAAESSPARKQDWLVLAGALGQRGLAAEVVCRKENPNAQNLAIRATVDGSGRLLGLVLLNYGYEPTRQCMERNMGGTPYPRNGKDTVRVEITLPG